MSDRDDLRRRAGEGRGRRRDDPGRIRRRWSCAGDYELLVDLLGVILGGKKKVINGSGGE